MAGRRTGIWMAGAWLALASCSSEPAPADAENAAAAATVWPAALKTVGNGFPTAGAPCRQVGETAATVDFLDDSATLVGCPTAEQAQVLGGKIVGAVEGITLVSVPRAAVPGEGDGQPDATVAGTAYHATAAIPCTLPDIGAGTCQAGVTRAPDQIAVDITLPKGGTRTLLFDGQGKFVTHSSAEADGSAALASSAKREEDWTIVSVGKEAYRIPDALVLGG
jgi:hypothetical protein